MNSELLIIMHRRNIVLATALFAGGLIALWLFLPPNISSSAQVSNSAEAIARGEYLITAGGCISCHRGQTEKTSEALSGGLALETDFGIFYAPNITPDEQT